jgi:hypothetical protein
MIATNDLLAPIPRSRRALVGSTAAGGGIWLVTAVYRIDSEGVFEELGRNPAPACIAAVEIDVIKFIVERQICLRPAIEIAPWHPYH